MPCRRVTKRRPNGLADALRDAPWPSPEMPRERSRPPSAFGTRTNGACGESLPVGDEGSRVRWRSRGTSDAPPDWPAGFWFCSLAEMADALKGQQ